MFHVKYIGKSNLSQNKSTAQLLYLHTLPLYGKNIRGGIHKYFNLNILLMEIHFQQWKFSNVLRKVFKLIERSRNIQTSATIYTKALRSMSHIRKNFFYRRNKTLKEPMFIYEGVVIST